jgi:hypothetical protein
MVMIEFAEMRWAVMATIRTISNYKPTWHQQFQYPWEEFPSKPENPTRSLTVYWVVASEEEHTDLG